MILNQPAMSVHASRFDEQDWTTHVVARRSPPRAVVAAAGDADCCAEILTLAFARDPAARWLYPDPGDYLRWFPEFIRAFGGDAIKNGTAHVVRRCATALWLPPETHSDDGALTELIERSIPLHRRDEVFAVFAQMDDYQPREPHWHLPLIGVDPLQQRRGYGSVLLSHMLARLDEQGAPAHLEATCPENVALYERHGFEVIGVIQAGTSPSIFPMLRKPA